MSEFEFAPAMRKLGDDIIAMVEASLSSMPASVIKYRASLEDAGVSSEIAENMAQVYHNQTLILIASTIKTNLLKAK